MSVEVIWRELEAAHELGGSRRIGIAHESDFYCSLDTQGRRGLLLLTDFTPQFPPPAFGALDIVLGHRQDGRYSLAVWLKVEALATVFTLLCDDLVSTVRGKDPDSVPALVLARLARWRRLLEAGKPNTLGMTELRGLVGELIVLRACLSVCGAAEVINGWDGPLDAPQDFNLRDKSLEAKAVLPGARTVRISSADQLDVQVSRDLFLAVVELGASAIGVDGSFSVGDLIEQIADSIEPDASVVAEFYSRLSAAGYIEHPDYHNIFFRVDSLRIFHVRGEFPRLTRIHLMNGVADVLYDIQITECSPFLTTLENQRGS